MSTGELVNKTIDLGGLVYHDISSFDAIDETSALKKTILNANKFYQHMFAQFKMQPKKNLLEFEQPFFMLDLPDIQERIPRVIAPPKEKVETRWEKFRREKGIKSNKKREKRVYDPATRKWVRRFGYKGMSQLKEKRDVIIKHTDGMENIDPFEEKSLKKKVLLGKFTFIHSSLLLI
jgi:hypothetical protein